MTRPEAAKLLAMLVAAFPRGPWPEETRELYERELGQLDRDIGGRAVQDAIRNCKFPPTIAELLECNAAHLRTVRRLERERQEEDSWNRGLEVYREGRWQKKPMALPEPTREATQDERMEIANKIARIGKGAA